MTKYLPFNSKYLPDFHVVEERDGNISRFPHTDQLPKLWRALNLEFLAGLPGRIARVDHRAQDYMKLQRFTAAVLFSAHVNQARRDNLRLFVLIDRNFVTRIAVVQHSNEHVEPAPIHRFKFYAGDDFFTDIHLNGKLIAFANHTLERFSERLPNAIGTDMTRLLRVFFGSPAVVMECNGSPAFVCHYDESVIAFPIRESDTDNEYFLPTCLSVNEINRLEPLLPPPAYTLHYDPVYRIPEVRNWDPIGWVLDCHQIWTRKEQLRPPEATEADGWSWSRIGHTVAQVAKKGGYGEGSRILFCDDIPGPSIIKLLPGEKEPHHIELENLRRYCPGRDWERIVPEVKAANPKWYGGVQTNGQP